MANNYAQPEWISGTRLQHAGFRELLLVCGVAASVLYPAADIVAGLLYPGYSFKAQAVSELFAIGAPTAGLVVRLFTATSLLVACFGAGVWLSAAGNRSLRFLSLMFLGNAVNSIVLWNFFPMHMRGVQATFTDEMHGLLAINPFVLLSVAVAIVAFNGRIRYYSIAAIVVLVVPALLSLKYIPLVIANQPTPFLGILERTAQYGYNAWLAFIAVSLLSADRPRVAT